MKVRIKVQPSGLLNGADWPGVGETMDLPDAAAEGMIKAGLVEKASGSKSEKVESDAKPGVSSQVGPLSDTHPEPEKRPAARKGVEKRKQGDDGGAA